MFLYSSTHVLQDGEDDDNDETDRTVDVRPEDDGGIVINIAPNHLDTDDEVERHSTTSIEEQPNLCHTMSKNRSVSESSGDEQPSNNIGSFPKSILRSQRNRNLSRSVSESSADENGTTASSVECHYDSIQDLNFESDCASLKKTVRFNDVVSRQLFRYTPAQFLPEHNLFNFIIKITLIAKFLLTALRNFIKDHFVSQ